MQWVPKLEKQTRVDFVVIFSTEPFRKRETFQLKFKRFHFLKTKYNASLKFSQCSLLELLENIPMLNMYEIFDKHVKVIHQLDIFSPERENWTFLNRLITPDANGCLMQTKMVK